MEAALISTDKIISYIGHELASAESNLKPSGLKVEKKLVLSDFDTYRVTKEKDIQQPEPTITIAGAAVASPGNITGISAAAKAGKTACTSVMIAGAISLNGEIDGFTDLEVLPNPTGKAVIHFDTEQSEADQQSNLNTVLRRANFTSTPNYYRSYNIRQLGLNDYQKTTNNICELCNEAFNGVHLIVIDGGADYIASVNDEAAAYNIVQYFTHLSIKYNCPVIVIVHQNPGSDKERGHFGSEIQRKCYGLLSITKEGDVSTLQPKIMRKAGNGDVPLINYQYCKEKGYHVQVEPVNKMDAKAAKDIAMLKVIAAKVFTPLSALRHKDAIAQIMIATGRKETAAKDRLTEMVLFDIIKLHDDGHYRINVEGSERVGTGRNDL
ncbi:MAG: hypothetical protein JWQ09_2974 [Segetibacter sp.]|nr:hypothetical protein [Segetibacter sp.]